MENTLNCQVIMISTKELARKGSLALNKDINDLFIAKLDCVIHKQQHLYFVSDNKIKEGDYGIVFAEGIDDIGRGYYVFKHDGSNLAKLNSICKGSKKIEASTDKLYLTSSEFKDPKEWYVPNIPKEFIKEYVESKGKIKEVTIKLDLIHADRAPNGFETFISVNDNNDIVIIFNEKIYTRDEVIKLLKLYTNEKIDAEESLNFNFTCDNWINDNL
jgi:hypothetical protein